MPGFGTDVVQIPNQSAPFPRVLHYPAGWRRLAVKHDAFQLLPRPLFEIEWLATGKESKQHTPEPINIRLRRNRASANLLGRGIFGSENAQIGPGGILGAPLF